LCFSAAFAAAAIFMTPIYRAEVVLVPTNSQGGKSFGSSAMGQLGGLASLAGINLGAMDQETEEALAVWKSREFTEAFINDRNLMPVLLYGLWDAKNQQWKGDRKKWPTLARASKFFDKSVRNITHEKMTGLVRMTIEWKDPRMAADWANTLVERLNEEMRARAIARANASVQYLEQELAKTTTVETRQAISRLMEEQIDNKMFANVTTEYAFRVVDRALPPDPRDKVRPQRLLLLVLGPTLGLLFGAFAVLLFRSMTQSASSR
jgi:capsular polysaccharide biosynthesis protein